MQDSDVQFFMLDKIKYPWVNQFYKRVYKKGVASNDQRVFVLQKNAIICSAKLVPLDKQLLLTGVVCDPSYRGQGYAPLLIAKVLALQTQPVYCFSYDRLTSFYLRQGFVAVDAQTVPANIREKFHCYGKKKRLQLMRYSSFS